MSRLLTVIVLSILSLGAHAQSLKATVDRSRINAGETIELTLQSSDPTLFGRPELEPLELLFDVLGTRQVNQLSNGTGAKASTQWIVTLQPKNNGYVVIPPLQMNELRSEPITLYVEQPDSADAAQKAPVYIQTSLDSDSVYVQAQAILTLRIFHSVSMYDDSTLSPLEIPDARVDPLGEPYTYETDVNGVRHGVIERRYAIFPQHSGKLEIPSQTFTATAVQNTNSANNPFGSRPGKVVRIKSPSLTLNVKAQPANYPAGQPWLPARSMSLSESWQPEPDQAHVGDSLTRSLTLRAEGLSSAQLPPLPPTLADDLRRYPDQPQLANQSGEQGIIGSREEREALVPNHAGTVELPAIKVFWWNTDTDHVELAELPAQTLNVKASTLPPTQTNELLGSTNQPLQTAQARLWPWQLSTALLSLSTLLGFFMWWRTRRQPAVLPSQQNGPSTRDLLDELKRTCLANDSQATRYALDAWARQQPETLADMAARFIPLSEALDGLNGALYSESGLHWQGRNLWLAIRSLPPAQDLDTPTNNDSNPLPPLYPR